MLLEEIRQIKSSDRELRSFGFVMASFFVLLGGWLLWKHQTNTAVLFVLAALFLVPALLLPKVLRPIQKVWMTLALLMGWVMSRVILIVLFYFIFTPIGFIKRTTGKISFEGGPRGSLSSYWISRDDGDYPRERYEKQF
jgi:hypothetical protein